MKTKSSSLITSISALVTGTVIAQLIVVIATPALSRLYSPEQFGILAIFLSAAAVLNVVSSLKYELAIPLAKDDTEAKTLTTLSLIILALFSSFVYAMYLVFKPQLLAFESIASIHNYYFLIPVSVLISGLYVIYVHVNIRKNEFKEIAKSKIHQSVSLVICQIAFWKLGTLALLISNIISQVVALLVLFKSTRSKKVNNSRVRLDDLRNSASRHKKFPIFSTLDGLINKLGVHIPPIFLGLYFSPVIAGYYLMADRVLRLPVTLISSAVSKVFYAKLGANFEQNRYVIEAYIMLMIRLLLPITLIVIFFGSDIFRIILGDQWELAGEFGRVMAPWMFLVFIASPLTTLFAILDKQQYGATFQSLLLTVRLVSIVATSSYNDPFLTIVAFTLSSALCWLFFLMWVMHISGVSFRKALEIFSGSLCASVLIYWISQKSFIYIGTPGLIFPLVLLSVYYFTNYKRIVLSK